MASVFRCIFTRCTSSTPWSDKAPIREELFGIERLEQHAESLAAAQTISLRPPSVPSLHTRLRDNNRVLLAAYRASVSELESHHNITPAAEWLLDNYHLVEKQIYEIRDDLPLGYYRQLPKLAGGPFAGYPRVFGLAWGFVAHTDSHFDPESLRRFIAAYQRVQPLTIGELWAVAITLRIVLIENLRRLSDQIISGREERAAADTLANFISASGNSRSSLEADIATRSSRPLSEHFAAQIAKRLRDHDPRTTPALGWLEERLSFQNTSIDEMVQRAQQREGAANVSVRNVITSMRLISTTDWADLFESVSLVDMRLCAGSSFASMDFATRNLYRNAIEQLARGSSLSELDVADYVLAASKAAPGVVPDAADLERAGDPGYYLIAEGRDAFEKKIGFRPSFGLKISRFNLCLGIGGYVGALALVSALLLSLALYALWGNGLPTGWLALFIFAGILPATEVATALVNRMVVWNSGTVVLPGLELKSGVPETLRTLVAVPTLLTSEIDLLKDIEHLEIHYLSGLGGHLTFALLTDGVDAQQENIENDARYLAVAVTAIKDLNQRYGPGPDGDRFLLLHRRRLFNESEKKWMGWERKRGKLHELNRLLRGATDTTFISVTGTPVFVPSDVRYVITLDADTRLPRDAASHMIGKMAHPLNRPKFSLNGQRVVKGYGILQPRVTPSLPIDGEGSFYQRIFSGPSGMDPYAAATSDVYQDLFGEGSYTGKGIYDVLAFEASLSDRVPENSMLSHDLFEGIFARAGLASDIEVVEEFPARYDVAEKRQHRWTRGDWQLLPWVLGCQKGDRFLPSVGRWKMVDNLRRSLLAPFAFAALGVCWLLPLPSGVVGVLLLLASFAIPSFLAPVFSVLHHRARTRVRNHINLFREDVARAAMQSALSVVFLADQTWRMMDAILRTLIRVYVTRRHLLEWTTAAQSAGGERLDWYGFYRHMRGGLLLAVLMAGAALSITPSSWPLVAPFLLLWLSAPLVALWVSLPTAIPRKHTISEDDAAQLRQIARRTWRFFETFVTPADNMLPPDNFQEDPQPIIAHRTSPTNIGLYMLSAVTARDFGWAGTTETIERLEAVFASMKKLARFKGHFFNWYGTQDLSTLSPAYVSTVDSGNFAGHLIALANACEEWREAVTLADIHPGITDMINLVRDAIHALPAANGTRGQELSSIFDEIENVLTGRQKKENRFPALKRLAEKATKTVDSIAPALGDDGFPDLVFWTQAVKKAIIEHERDYAECIEGMPSLKDRLSVLARMARRTALDMNFTFLLDPERKLLSIGYSLDTNNLDLACYDLLASEARLASLFAVAKGDVTTQHWFRLGRVATPIGSGSALLSWAGSMFEYLMPSLVMRAPWGSLLEQTSRLVVERQQSYARSLGVPWGISESAYSARDIEFTYQYSNFGVPGLGLKRGLSENVVIAPYATGLAAMVDPRSARQNYARLEKIGARGRYGFYEALDFTRSRLPDGEKVAIVRNFMAHHQGMTIVALANTLFDGRMRNRFHREPMIQASELLLQERMPRDIIIAYPRVEEVKEAIRATTVAPTVRRVSAVADGPPVTHLLSNGHYVVMLTARGAGYSRWRDLAITRWREDITSDDWGSFIFLRDVLSGQIWSAGACPAGGEAEDDEVVFGEDHATFTHYDGKLTTTTDVLVSGEDDGEVRRVSLTNSGRRARVIELTSYAEIVLTTPAADNAHPAFAKMFVETEYLAEFGALIATRRQRSRSDPPIWAAHFSVVEGRITTDPQYETDRARFLGRNRSINRAKAVMEEQELSNTTGTVLDPIFSLRQRLIIPSGAVVRVAFWTIVASSRDELLKLIDKHCDRNAFVRAKMLAWTQAQVQLRHLEVDAKEASDFQRLATPILYADPRFRASSDAIIRGAGPQSALWALGISGDLPIVLLHIDEIEDLGQVRQLLRAHEYWRMKRLGVDLIIINERASSYMQDLQTAIDTAIRSSQARPRFDETLVQGAVHALRADRLTLEARLLLYSIARVTLSARRGSIVDQLAHLPMSFYPRALPHTAKLSTPSLQTSTVPSPQDLEFFNGLGGFDKNGREYVTILNEGQTTPAPWINVIANPGFGFQVSAEGGGYTWAGNSRENQLTPWSNDPVIDPTGEVLYIRDESTGALWCTTAQPIRDDGLYITRHGPGYSRFEHQTNGIALELLHYVPLADPIKISRLSVCNTSGKTRYLSITAYTEWVLGTSQGATGPFIITSQDEKTGALLARNPWNIGASRHVAFADLSGRQSSVTADRTEFIGYHGSIAAPAALSGSLPLSGATGAGLDPCAALQCSIVLGAGQTIEIVSFIGQCESTDEASALISRYRTADLDAVLQEVMQYWENLLGAVQVKTPDRAMDIMLNGWLLYQTLACRLWARSAFYQASGAYGFRDQLQDGMALTALQPDETRRHLLRAAARQFVEGDVQHWWFPHSGLGVRTHISDDRVWLSYATATYIICSGDTAVLDESVPFLTGPILRPDEHDALFQPMIADEEASLFDHCARGLDQCLELTGKHGLPLIGTGDWNDGMNRVGEEGSGESVWLGWLLIRTIALFAPLAETRDAVRAQRWRAHAVAVQDAIEREAWDGRWYRRATFDDGTWLGSEESEECRIDSIAQSWAVLSEAGIPSRCAAAMASLEKYLINPTDAIALLFTPPFDKTPHDPGYIKGYPPGLRENGGQYSHAAMWSILAFAQQGAGDKAVALFSLLNPINHARTPAETARYKVEPYAVAADVYSVAPHTGRGGWTWYTGSAGWMYRAGMEGILGIRREGNVLVIAPCIPDAWPGFSAVVTMEETRCEIRVTNGGGVSYAALDDVSLESLDNGMRIPLDGNMHKLLLAL